MYTVRKVTDDLYWVGANEHRLHQIGRASCRERVFLRV